MPRILFALSSFGNLIKSGRISKAKGWIAKVLNLWGIGEGSREGSIVVGEKTRGAKKAVEALVAHMKEKEFQGLQAAITYCGDSDLAEKLKKRIQEIWVNAEVEIRRMRGLCSYYAERGGRIRQL